MNKTHAMRVLDAKQIPYTPKVYDAAGDFHSGSEAAVLLGVDAASVYKTLIVLRDGEARSKPIVVMIPVADEVDLKRLAATVGAKKVRMAKKREAEELTGMQVGGISALGLKQPAKFEIVIDDRAQLLERMHISGGARGVDLELLVDDLVRALGAITWHKTP
jgi:Cys-tRNA(Pro)/Cys-tRNA(Cys) deacylase